MLSLDYFDHIAPSGLTPVQRIRTTGYIPSSEVGYVIGENLAWGTLTLATPQAIVNAWIASPEHLANILEGKYRDTGHRRRARSPAGSRRRSRRRAVHAGVRRHRALSRLHLAPPALVGPVR